MADVDRFETPLYSLGEAGHYLGLSKTTLARWAQGKERGTAIVTTVPGQPRGSAVIPFVGLAEGLVLAVIRRSGVPLQRVRPALDRLRRELGLTHALASKALYTNGAEVLYDFAEQQGDTPEARSARQLVVVRNNQHVFTRGRGLLPAPSGVRPRWLRPSDPTAPLRGCRDRGRLPTRFRSADVRPWRGEGRRRPWSLLGRRVTGDRV